MKEPLEKSEMALFALEPKNAADRHAPTAREQWHGVDEREIGRPLGKRERAASGLVVPVG